MKNNPGSFRDPSGRVFSENGDIYRHVYKPGIASYEQVRDAKIYDKLIEAELLIAHKEVDNGLTVDKDAVYCLNHPKIPMVSYPWEWSFSMLKDAALIHLDMMELLIPSGFWLRDANAFNVQFNGEKPIFIDTLSIGERVPESPWVAYGQFCSHFLAPLALAAYGDIRFFSIWRNQINGFPLDLVVKMLPFWRRVNPGIFMHLVMHAKYQNTADKKEDLNKGKTKKALKVNDISLIGLIRSLRRTISGIHWKRSSAVWEAYDEIRTYNTDAVSEKTTYVSEKIEALKPSMVWDLGANTGEFSLIAASHGAFVVSIDGDPACTESLYKKVSQDGIHGILPLTMDLANPSPGLGWNNSERLSLSERGPADLVLALALIHHLVLSSSIPMGMVAEWFSSIAKHVLVEYVPIDDPMVKLTENRLEEHLPYSFDEFKSSFGQYFNFSEQKQLANGRTLFLCERR